MITLKNVDYDNFWEIIDLCVYENQRDFLTSNAVSLAQAKVQQECIPLAIYNDEKPIGFAMYGIDRKDGQYWIYRFMIDRRYQSKGFGRASFKMLTELIKQDKKYNKIYNKSQEFITIKIKIFTI